MINIFIYADDAVFFLLTSFPVYNLIWLRSACALAVTCCLSVIFHQTFVNNEKSDIFFHHPVLIGDVVH